MFEKLLLATDGSPHAVQAALAAAGLAQDLKKASVTILHVMEKTPSDEQVRRADFVVEMLLDEDVKAALSETEELLAKAGVAVTIKVAIGHPAEEIIKHAERGSYDLILIGSRGLNAISEILQGSVSRRVTHEAGCPVMVVK